FMRIDYDTPRARSKVFHGGQEISGDAGCADTNRREASGGRVFGRRARSERERIFPHLPYRRFPQTPLRACSVSDMRVNRSPSPVGCGQFHLDWFVIAVFPSPGKPDFFGRGRSRISPHLAGG
ncbi:MAG: hypothetical protein OXI82_05135, partial [Nitrospinae bacterium]|nr:hypothetical protein [Nitrospinota bacterium]